MMNIIVIALLCCVYIAMADEDPLLVQTEQGSLVGVELTNEVDKEPYYGFFNIPYARPPTGERRFKDPEEPLPWEGVRDAQEEGETCLSMNPIFQNVDGDEDCLVLNIYTPKPPSELQSSPLPVMVWIHGGAYHMGSGSPLYYGPDFLIRHDVVVVTMNYRLGVFGFLSLQNEEVPGNAGLKDQVMALKWLKANIKSFGGDPDSVTIFGESAGASSVHYLMLSASAKGLFHRAIMQSGTAICPWASTTLTVSSAKELGKVFDCGTEDPTELLKCLRNLDAEDLARYQYNVVAPVMTEPLNVKIFIPCIEPTVSKNPIINKDPRKIMQEGTPNDVPFIIGNVEMETLFLSKGGVLPEKLEQTIYKTLNKDPSIILALKMGEIEESLRKKAGEEIKKFYFKDQPISNESLVNLIHATTDLYFLLGTNDVISYHLAHGASPVYQYFFTLDASFGRIKKLIGDAIKGPSHADDIGYLFYMNLAPPTIDKEDNGYKGMLKMVKLWTDFAKFGNPTQDEELNVVWKPATLGTRYYLQIDNELTLHEDLEKERIEFWNNLRMKENLPDL